MCLLSTFDPRVQEDSADDRCVTSADATLDFKRLKYRRLSDMTGATGRRSAELTIQEMARRSGFTEPTLRYYEKAGLLGPVARDESSGHRRYGRRPRTGSRHSPVCGRRA